MRIELQSRASSLTPAELKLTDIWAIKLEKDANLGHVISFELRGRGFKLIAPDFLSSLKSSICGGQKQCCLLPSPNLAWHGSRQKN